MEPMAQKFAFPFTFVLKREGPIWAALACEVDITSCGDTVDDAREALKDAIELYVLPKFERREIGDIARPIERSDLRTFCKEPLPDEEIRVEYHSLTVTTFPVLSFEFIPQQWKQMSCEEGVLAR